MRGEPKLYIINRMRAVVHIRSQIPNDYKAFGETAYSISIMASYDICLGAMIFRYAVGVLEVLWRSRC